jgi:hypothetical protein
MDVVLSVESAAYCGALAAGAWWLGARAYRTAVDRRLPAQGDRGEEEVELEDLLPASRAPRRRAGRLSLAQRLCGSLAHEGPWLDVLYLLKRPPEPLAPELLQRSSQRVCRLLLLRSLGFVYVFAFLCVAFQARTLIGERGLMPCDCGEGGCGWLSDSVGLDRALELLGWAGVILGALQLLGLDSVLVSAALFLLYLIFYRTARRASGFFHYGWDFQAQNTQYSNTNNLFLTTHSNNYASLSYCIHI